MAAFTKKEIEEKTNKEVEIVLGELNDDEVFSYKGKIISFNVDDEYSNSLVDFCFHTQDGAIKTFNFNNLKKIRLL